MSLPRGARKAAGTLAAALLGLVPAAGLPDTDEVARGGSVVRRTTLIVSDAEASIAFYRDVIGMVLWLDLPGKVSATSLPVDVPVGEPSRFAIMKGRDPWIGMIGILQYGVAQPPAGRPEHLEAGDAILMMETDDLDGIWGRMQAAGTPVFREPQVSQVTGADGKSWTARFLFAFDPDGNMLEINQPEWLAKSVAGD